MCLTTETPMYSWTADAFVLTDRITKFRTMHVEVGGTATAIPASQLQAVRDITAEAICVLNCFIYHRLQPEGPKPTCLTLHGKQ